MQKHFELKIPPAAITLVCAIGMWFVSARLPLLGVTVVNRIVVSGLIAGVGVVIGLIAVFVFRSKKTTVHPNRPQATSSLVTTGLYGVSRNPMYLAMLLGLAGYAVYLANAAAFAFLPVYVLVLNRLQIVPEERVLEEKFGPAFLAYRNAVRRWL